MGKFLSQFLVISMLTMSIAPAALAQEIGGTNPEEQIEVSKSLLAESSWMTCDLQGGRDASKRSTTGSTAAGVASGLLLGLIGTVIAVLAQSKSDPPESVLLSLEESSDECQYAYLKAYREKSVSKKRKAALTGGLIGTVILVSLYFATGGE